MWAQLVAALLEVVLQKMFERADFRERVIGEMKNEALKLALKAAEFKYRAALSPDGGASLRSRGRTIQGDGPSS